MRMVSMVARTDSNISASSLRQIAVFSLLKNRISFCPFALFTLHYTELRMNFKLHHAHGALVLSEPVKRPLAISPPFLDDGSTEEAR